MNVKMAISIFSANVINRLLLSFLVLTKVITLSGVHCIAKLDRNEKSLKAVGFMKNLGKEQQFFKVFDNESAKATNVSPQISRDIAASGKCFADGELVKKYCC